MSVRKVGWDDSRREFQEIPEINVENPEAAQDRRRYPIYIVCSPRPRVGKTLIARLLIEYKTLQNVDVVAFDVSAAEASLAKYLPARTIASDVANVRGQMALFDRLLYRDGIGKVIDLGHDSYDEFFAVARKIGFVDEADRQFIEPVVIFVADGSKKSLGEYSSLCKWFSPIVPLYNDAAGVSDKCRALYNEVLKVPQPLRIRKLSPVLNATIDRPMFSFCQFLSNQTGNASELYIWMSAVFGEFRRLETVLRLDGIWRGLRRQLVDETQSHFESAPLRRSGIV